jgi:hypothetical protein
MDTFLALINEDARIVITGHDVSRAIWNVVEEERTALLTKLRDEVEGLQKFEFRLSRPSLIGRVVPYKNGEWIKRSEVLALIKKEINK